MNPNRIYLVYYRYDDDVSLNHPRWWINYLTSKITKSPYIHVEIVFSNGDVYGIQMGGSITKVNDKSYTRDRYTTQAIPMNATSQELIRRFLEEKMKRHSSFNYRGFYLLPIFPHSGARNNKWFCSELTITSLQQGGLLEDVEPHKISPGKLFEIVTESGIGFVARMVNSSNENLII